MAIDVAELKKQYKEKYPDRDIVQDLYNANVKLERRLIDMTWRFWMAVWGVGMLLTVLWSK